VLVVCGIANAAPTPRSLFPALTAIGTYTIDQARTSVTSLDWNTQPTPEPKWSLF
jgi:hypothetical protein